MPADEEGAASDSAVFRKASASTRYAWLTEMNQKVNIDEHDSLMTSRNKCIVGATLHLGMSIMMIYFANVTASVVASSGGVVAMGVCSALLACYGMAVLLMRNPLMIYSYFVSLFVLSVALFGSATAAAGYINMCGDPRNQCAFVCCGDYAERLHSNSGEGAMASWDRSSDDSYTGPLPCFFLQYREVIIGVATLTFLFAPAVIALALQVKHFADALSDELAKSQLK